MINKYGTQKLTADNFDARLKEADIVSKKDIDFVKRTDFSEKLKNINEKVTSNKTKHIQGEKKLNEKLEKVKLIPKNGYQLC